MQAMPKMAVSRQIGNADIEHRLVGGRMRARGRGVVSSMRRGMWHAVRRRVVFHRALGLQEFEQAAIGFFQLLDTRFQCLDTVVIVSESDAPGR